jgi:hypothetical protein
MKEENEHSLRVELHEATGTIPILRYKNIKWNEREQSKSNVRGCSVFALKAGG